MKPRQSLYKALLSEAFNQDNFSVILDTSFLNIHCMKRASMLTTEAVISSFWKLLAYFEPKSANPVFRLLLDCCPLLEGFFIVPKDKIVVQGHIWVKPLPSYVCNQNTYPKCNSLLKSLFTVWVFENRFIISDDFKNRGRDIGSAECTRMELLIKRKQ